MKHLITYCRHWLIVGTDK